MKAYRTLAAIAASLAVPLSPALGTTGSYAQVQPQAQAGSRLFPETGHRVEGKFLEYWEQHGGLPQQGYPISDEMREVSPTDGKTYAVQYFERAVFELHPENRQPYDVLLSLLGAFDYKQRFPNGSNGSNGSGAPNQKPNNDPGSVLFPQTGKRVGGSFLQYWQSHGGLMQQGFPISDEFQQVSPLDGKTYTVQYFERAVFEWHPENKGTQYEVLLSQLGTFRFRVSYLESTPLIPGKEERLRFGLAASETYLVWSEMTYTPGGGITTGTGDIMGYDLRTGKPMAVSEGEPNDQLSPDISGPLVIYQSQPDADHIGYDYVHGKDLAMGQRYKIATGPLPCRYPKVAGKSAAWIEFDNDMSRLLTKDVDAGSAITVTVVPHGPANASTTLIDPAISDSYILWGEIAYWDPRRGDQPRTSYVKAYNRKTGEIKAIVEFRAGFGGASGFEYALDGDRVFITGSDPRILDLGTGHVASIEWAGAGTYRTMEHPALKGDIAVWSAASTSMAEAGAEGFGLDIWGVNLKDAGRKAVPLVIGRGDQYAAIAGDRLAWLTTNSGGPEANGIGIRSLPAAFATAPDRLKALGLTTAP